MKDRSVAKKEIEFSTGQCMLFATVEGDGPALVFLHGQLGIHDVVYPLVASLSDEWRIITPDVRGRGRSVCPYPEEHSWDRYADDVIAILDALGVERAVVGGVSLGAGIALRTALRHPERVAALVLHSSVYPGQDIGWLEEQMQVQTQVVEAAEAVMRDAPEAKKILEAPKWTRHDPKSLAAGIIGLGFSQPFDGRNDLASVLVPALVVPGADSLHPRRISEMYRDAIAKATWFEPESAKFRHALGKFLKDQFDGPEGDLPVRI